jgi:hypothetical protein
LNALVATSLPAVLTPTSVASCSGARENAVIASNENRSIRRSVYFVSPA